VGSGVTSAEVWANDAGGAEMYFPATVTGNPLSRKANAGSGELKVGNLPDGIYMIRAGDKVRKFLINNY
jgi:hypothetical protein